MNNKKGIALISLIVAILTIITVVLIIAEIIVITIDINRDNNNITISRSENINTEQTENNNLSKDGLNKWLGRYENGNISIDIWLDNINSLGISISQTGNSAIISSHSTSFDVTIDDVNTNQIIHESEMFDKKDNVIITYMNNEINIVATSTDEESLLNHIDGNYKLIEFDRLGWDGTYLNGETNIILSERYGNLLMITINGQYLYSTYTQDYTSEKVSYEDNFFGEEENIVIKKTENGISIQAKSTEEDHILNKISGEYIKN